MSLQGAGFKTVETNGVTPDQRPEPVENEPLRVGLRTAHREILRRVFLGEQLVQVAQAVGMPYATVKYITKSPLFQAALAEMQSEADGKVIDTAQRMRMERALTDAAESGIPIALKAMNDSPSPATKAKIAFGFLDRAGLGPSRKVEEKREGFREMLERLDEMERHMAPGSEVTATVQFAVRREGVGYGNQAGVSPADDSNTQRGDSVPAEDAVLVDHPTVRGTVAGAASFLSKSLG